MCADCYDCIDKCILVGGKANLCPVCKNLLGPNPWEHNKLKYDFMLDSLVRKVRHIFCCPAGRGVVKACFGFRVRCGSRQQLLA